MPQKKQSETHKQCPRCEQWLSRESFGTRTNGHTQSYCPDCRRKYGRQYDGTTQRHKGDWDTSKPGSAKASGRPCPVCDKTFYPNKSNLKRDLGKYCSPTCAAEGRKKSGPTLKCKQCGEPFEANRQELKRGGAQFCCPGCWYEYNTGPNNPLWTEHFTSYRGRGWRQIRELVLMCDGYKCQRCGKTNDQELADIKRGLSVHHKEPYREGENNSTYNLETLCAACHMKAEWKIRRRNQHK